MYNFFQFMHLCQMTLIRHNYLIYTENHFQNIACIGNNTAGNYRIFIFSCIQIRIDWFLYKKLAQNPISVQIVKMTYRKSYFSRILIEAHDLVMLSKIYSSNYLQFVIRKLSFLLHINILQ